MSVAGVRSKAATMVQFRQSHPLMGILPFFSSSVARVVVVIGRDGGTSSVEGELEGERF